MKLPDLLDSDVLKDPYPAYSLLRSTYPVHWDESLNGWLVTRHDDVYNALRDPSRFSSDRLEQMVSGRVSEAARKEAEPLVRTAAQWMWMNDPPFHTTLRGLVNKGFTPRAISGLEKDVAQIVDMLLEPHLASGRMDVVADLAYPLPAYVLADLYGIPREDADLLKGWSDAMKLFIGGSPDLSSTAGGAVAGLKEMMRYFTEVVEARRHQPQDDLVTRLVNAEHQGELLSQEQIVANLVLVLAASYVTTMDMMGNGLLALLRNRDQWERLIADPGLVPRAIDEILRFDGPVQLTHRRATQDIELRGSRIRQGDIVYLIRGAANRDPEKFSDPDRLDVGREDTGHVAFGAGVHYCVGAALARMEGELALRALLTRCPGLRLDEEREPVWRGDSVQFRGLRSLPVRFDGA